MASTFYAVSLPLCLLYLSRCYPWSHWQYKSWWPSLTQGSLFSNANAASFWDEPIWWTFCSRRQQYSFSLSGAYLCLKSEPIFSVSCLSDYFEAWTMPLTNHHLFRLPRQALHRARPRQQLQRRNLSCRYHEVKVQTSGKGQAASPNQKTRQPMSLSRHHASFLLRLHCHCSSALCARVACPTWL